MFLLKTDNKKQKVSQISLLLNRIYKNKNTLNFN